METISFVYMLKLLNRDTLKTATIIEIEHHEKYNEGYPRGLMLVAIFVQNLYSVRE